MTATTGRRPANASTVGVQRDDDHIREQTDLDHRYGRIGISAVAAALHYTASIKPAEAPAASKIDWRFVEAAA
jgi:hypothetical protein